MPLLLPPSWMQAAGFVAIGYGVRNAGICKAKEIQVGAVLASFCAMQATPGCTASLYAGCCSLRVYCLSSSNDTSVPCAVRSRQAYSLSLSRNLHPCQVNVACRLPSLHSAWALAVGATAIAALLSLAVMWYVFLQVSSVSLSQTI